MRYSVVYLSQTGNTRMLAEAIAAALPTGSYCGAPAPEAAEAEVIFAGFWTDKGSCSPALAEFLQSLHGKQVFLFGTAGFGGDPAYYDTLLGNVKQHLPADSTLCGSFMCQGKMPAPLGARYEAMAKTEPEKYAPMLENFNRALSHPDEADLAALRSAVAAVL